MLTSLNTKDTPGVWTRQVLNWYKLLHKEYISIIKVLLYLFVFGALFQHWLICAVDRTHLWVYSVFPPTICCSKCIKHLSSPYTFATSIDRLSIIWCMHRLYCNQYCCMCLSQGHCPLQWRHPLQHPLWQSHRWWQGGGESCSARRHPRQNPYLSQAVWDSCGRTWAEAQWRRKAACGHCQNNIESAQDYTTGWGHISSGHSNREEHSGAHRVYIDKGGDCL